MYTIIKNAGQDAEYFVCVCVCAHTWKQQSVTKFVNTCGLWRQDSGVQVEDWPLHCVAFLPEIFLIFDETAERLRPAVLSKIRWSCEDKNWRLELKKEKETFKNPRLQLCCSVFGSSVISDLCDSMDCNLPAPLSMGILQARILGWVAMPSSRESSQPRDRTQVSHQTLAGASQRTISN